MAKTLNQFLEGYLKVKSADEQKFIDKHVTAKNPDRNGNGDDVFKGSTKTIDRRKDRKGYNPGEDEKVYEALKGGQKNIDANKNGKLDAHDFKLLRAKKKVAEEVEELDELSKKTLGSYVKKAGTSRAHIAGKQKGVDDALRGVDAAMRYVSDTSNLDKSRKQLKDVSNRLDNKDFNRQHGIYTAVKKLTKEESEQVDEGQKPYVSSESGGVGRSAVAHVLDSKGKIVQSFHKKEHGTGYMKKANDYLDKNYNKMKNEEAEIQEASYSAKSAAAGKDIGKPGKQFSKIATAAAKKYGSAESGQKVAGAVLAKLRKEEKLVNLISDISEAHQRTIMTVFEKLNDDNKTKFLEACDTPDGVEQMLDFAINNRGE